MSRGPAQALPALRRPPERRFFSSYWSRGSFRRVPYEYQWFLSPCRAFAFTGLCHAPRGPVAELGSGVASTMNEPNPASFGIDVVATGCGSLQNIVADAQILPLLDSSVAAVWEQTMLMHVEPLTVAHEVRRILMPGGVFAVVEPVTGHPLVSLARRGLPGRRVCPRFLTNQELESLGSHFTRGNLEWFFLMSPLALLVSRRTTPAVRWLQALDAEALRRMPRLRHRAWYGAGWFQK